VSDDDIVQRLRRIHGGSAVVEVTQEAADEIERLRAERDADDYLHSQVTIILHRVAVAFHGEPPENGWWSWHHLPERAAAERALADQMARALAAVKADRPSVHTHEVWTAVCDALDDYGKARRERCP
jgi:hypothetical protein